MVIWGRPYMKAEIWLLEHDWPTRFPRVYLFWHWVLTGPDGMIVGFRMWWRWLWRAD